MPAGTLLTAAPCLIPPAHVAKKLIQPLPAPLGGGRWKTLGRNYRHYLQLAYVPSHSIHTAMACRTYTHDAAALLDTAPSAYTHLSVRWLRSTLICYSLALPAFGSIPQLIAPVHLFVPSQYCACTAALRNAFATYLPSFSACVIPQLRLPLLVPAFYRRDRTAILTRKHLRVR